MATQEKCGKNPPLLRKKLLWTAIFMAFNGLGYLLTSAYPLFEFYHLDYTPYDQSIPYLPWTALLYISFYPLMALPLLLSPNQKLFSKMLKAYFLTSIISLSIFVLIPTKFDHYPPPSQDIFTTHIMNPIRKADNYGTNAWPSQHVLFSLLGATLLCCHGYLRTAIPLLLWGIAVSISTLTTKQHFIADVLASLALLPPILIAVHLNEILYLFQRKEQKL